MTNIFKRVVIGLIPSFALCVLVIILLSDQVTDGGYGLIPVFLLSPFIALFIAWLIGHLVFSLQNITLRIVTLAAIIIVTVGLAYVFGTNCDLQLLYGRHCNKLGKPSTVYVNSSIPAVRYPEQ
jgi:hypothetical protein